MNFKDLWKDYLRTGEDQSSGTEFGMNSNWRRYLAESGELETIHEPQDPDEIASAALSPNEIPGELYHATRPPLLSSISEQGLRDHADFSKHGAGQSGVSFATDLDALSGGEFGNMVLVFSGEELAASEQYEFYSHQDPTIDTPEAEIRVSMIDSAGSSGSGIDPKVESLGTTIPFHYCKALVFLYPVPKFEQKWLSENYPHLQIQIYTPEKEAKEANQGE